MFYFCKNIVRKLYFVFKVFLKEVIMIILLEFYKKKVIFLWFICIYSGSLNINVIFIEKIIW